MDENGTVSNPETGATGSADSGSVGSNQSGTETAQNGTKSDDDKKTDQTDSKSTSDDGDKDKDKDKDTDKDKGDTAEKPDTSDTGGDESYCPEGQENCGRGGGAVKDPCAENPDSQACKDFEKAVEAACPCGGGAYTPAPDGGGGSCACDRDGNMTLSGNGTFHFTGGNCSRANCPENNTSCCKPASIGGMMGTYTDPKCQAVSNPGEGGSYQFCEFGGGSGTPECKAGDPGCPGGPGVSPIGPSPVAQPGGFFNRVMSWFGIGSQQTGVPNVSPNAAPAQGGTGR